MRRWERRVGQQFGAHAPEARRTPLDDGDIADDIDDRLNALSEIDG